MDMLEAILLGIIQGVTEFLPVSSSGHLAIAPFLFGWEQQSLQFDVIVHGATLLAIIIYYRKRLQSLIASTFSQDSKSRKESIVLLRNITISSVPAVLIGLLFKGTVESLSSNIPIIAASLIIVGILLIAINRHFKNTVQITSLPGKSALFIGAMQAIALIRGVSRSGITIIGGAASGLSKQDAIEYAFLISIPVLAGGFLFGLYDVLTVPVGEGTTFSYASLLVGFVSAFISGYLAITFLIKYIQQHDFAVFGYYRIILGIILLLIAV